MTDVAERLRQARVNAGFRSAREAAMRNEWVYTTYASHENAQRGIRVEDIRKYARAFGVDPMWLLNGKDGGNGPLVGPQKIKVVGKVAAGVWLESDNYYADGEVALYGMPSDRFPNAEQIAYKVEGPSMNKVLPDGSFAVGVTIESSRNPVHGDIVIVNRARGGLHEWTVKRYRQDGDEVQLVPESTDPRFQTPIALEADEDDTTVNVVAIVTGVYQAL